MKRRYLLLFALVSLMWTACSSDGSGGKVNDTLVLDSPAISDSLHIKTADADSVTVDTVSLDTSRP